jgi:histidyl-tRNA synthetase
VAQYYTDLVFPFKRYQIQKVWRGERPQEGRYREFYQCDIDVINNDKLSLHFDAEMPAIVSSILSGLNIGAFSICISNRKILEGFYSGLGIEDMAGAIRIADKLDKIGAKGVLEQLQQKQNLTLEVANRCLSLASIRTPDTSFIDQVKELGVQSPVLDEGLSELSFVIEYLRSVEIQSVVADLSIARGFDYYTGSVYEGKLLEFPKLGAIFSGGRYDNLAGSFINRKLPGVGISIGLTRIFAKLVAAGRIPPGPKCPTEILVVWASEQRRRVAVRTAHQLRQRGFKVELFYTPSNIGNQFRYASRKGIPFVWIPPFEDGQPDEVKEMATGVQIQADLQTWRAAR